MHLARDNETKRLRGFGFVEFKTAEAAAKAVGASGFDVGGRQVRVSFAPEKDGGKRGPGGPDGGEGGGGKRQMIKHPLIQTRSENCWFCLSSPKVEKHLVVSIGEEVYVALAKGPLVPEHVLILPITHYPAGSQLPDEVWAEVELYKKSLAECFRKEKQSGLVVYERATNTTSPHSHCHFQVIPVPGDKEAGAAEHFRTAGDTHNVALVPRPQWREDGDLDQYVWFEVPAHSSLLLHKVPPRQRHPLNFCREAVATLLGMPERADWKDCALTVDEETQMAGAFKKIFAPYDWSLKDD